MGHLIDYFLIGTGVIANGGREITVQAAKEGLTVLEQVKNASQAGAVGAAEVFSR